MGILTIPSFLFISGRTWNPTQKICLLEELLHQTVFWFRETGCLPGLVKINDCTLWGKAGIGGRKTALNLQVTWLAEWPGPSSLFIHSLCLFLPHGGNTVYCALDEIAPGGGGRFGGPKMRAAREKLWAKHHSPMWWWNLLRSQSVSWPLLGCIQDTRSPGGESGGMAGHEWPLSSSMTA